MLQQSASLRSSLCHNRASYEDHILTYRRQEALITSATHKLALSPKEFVPFANSKSHATNLFIIVHQSFLLSDLLTISSDINKYLFCLVFILNILERFATEHHRNQGNYTVSGQINHSSEIKCSFSGPRCPYIFQSVKRLPLNASKDDEHRFIVFRY